MIILPSLIISIKGESRFVCGGSGCSAEWTFSEVWKMALLTPQETEHFRNKLAVNAALQTLITKSVSISLE